MAGLAGAGAGGSAGVGFAFGAALGGIFSAAFGSGAFVAFGAGAGAFSAVAAAAAGVLGAPLGGIAFGGGAFEGWADALAVVGLGGGAALAAVLGGGALASAGLGFALSGGDLAVRVGGVPREGAAAAWLAFALAGCGGLATTFLAGVAAAALRRGAETCFAFAPTARVVGAASDALRFTSRSALMALLERLVGLLDFDRAGAFIRNLSPAAAYAGFIPGLHATDWSAAARLRRGAVVAP